MDRVLVFGGGSTPGGMLPLFPRSGAGWRQLDRWKRGFRHELAFQFIASLRDIQRVSKIRSCDHPSDNRKAYIEQSSTHEHLFAHPTNDTLPITVPSLPVVSTNRISPGVAKSA